MMEARRTLVYGVGGWIEDSPQHNIVAVTDQWYDDDGNPVGDPVPVEIPDTFDAPASLDIDAAGAPPVDVTAAPDLTNLDEGN